MNQAILSISSKEALADETKMNSQTSTSLASHC